MKDTLKYLTVAATFAFGALSTAHAEVKELDRVAVIVNTGVVLESEITDLIATITRQAKKNNQSLPADSALRTQVTDKLINDELMMQLGERMGVQVSDPQLDETLTNMAKENKQTLEEFRQSVIADGSDYEKYRESVRTELIAGEVRRASVRRRIFISEQEIDNLLEMMKEQTNTNVEYRLGHILIEFPADPTQEDMNTAKIRAEKTIELLNEGSDFSRIAMTASSDANALQGGDLGWKNINEMPTLFSDLIDGKNKDEVLGPIRTGLGYSILKILDVRGRQVVEIEEVRARHILIEPSIILSDAKAEQILAGLREKIVAGEATFEDMAKEHSTGPTGIKGGDLGWAEARIYDPVFRDMLASLKEQEISQPFRSSFGWHITRVEGRRTLDATSQMNKNRAHQVLFNRKFGVESARWLKETRDEAYIEVLE